MVPNQAPRPPQHASLDPAAELFCCRLRWLVSVRPSEIIEPGFKDCLPQDP